MEKDKLILKNETTIDLEAGASLENLKAEFDDIAALGIFWDQCTTENLSEVKIQNGVGLTVGTYKNMHLIAPEFILEKTEDNKIVATFGIRELKEVELLALQVKANTESIAVHDEAIGDMGAVMSALADQEGENV